MAKSCPMLIRHAAALTTNASRGLCSDAKSCSTPPLVTISLSDHNYYRIAKKNIRMQYSRAVTCIIEGQVGECKTRNFSHG